MSQVKITETVLRDAHQSLIATRMTTEEMLPILEAMDDVGYYSLEAWGGATFDACMRFLNEDPWERLRKIRARVKKTKLQMLFRGQNILGYRHYADDVVEYFVQKSIANGIDIIRIFDALNDPRNLKTAINATLKEGGHVQAAFSYTTGPVYTTEYYRNYAKQLEEMGANSICIKDMAGLLKPYEAYELVRTLKESVKIPIQLHTHYTSGLASMTLMKAVEAGVDVIDTALSPLAMGTSQPPTESMVAALAGTEYDTGLDLAKLDVLTRYFTPLREKYLKSGLLDPKVLKVNVNALMYQVPGGMLSNLMSQLKQAGKEDQLTAVLEEVPRVRADVGYPAGYALVPDCRHAGCFQCADRRALQDRYQGVQGHRAGQVRQDAGAHQARVREEDLRRRPADHLSSRRRSQAGNGNAPRRDAAGADGAGGGRSVLRTVRQGRPQVL